MFNIPAYEPMLNAPNNVTHGIWIIRGVGSSSITGTFTIPYGVYKIWRTVVAGGGGSVGSTGNGGDGTNSFFGDLIATFGAKSTSVSNGAGGSPNGMSGLNILNALGVGLSLGVGGSTPFGNAGNTTAVGYGSGAGSANNNIDQAYGAGSGGWYYRESLNVVQGMVFDAVAGAGGVAGAGVGGGTGAPGIVIIEW